MQLQNAAVEKSYKEAFIKYVCAKGGGGNGGSPIIVQFCGLMVLNMRTGGSKIMIVLRTSFMEAPSREIMVSISFTLDECQKGRQIQ